MGWFSFQPKNQRSFFKTSQVCVCVWSICITPCSCLNFTWACLCVWWFFVFKNVLFLDLFNAQIHNYNIIIWASVFLEIFSPALNLSQLLQHPVPLPLLNQAVDSLLDWFVFVLDVCRLYFSNFYKYISVWWTADDLYENTTTVVTHRYQINFYH